MKIRCYKVIDELSAEVLLIVRIPWATRRSSQNHHLLVQGTVQINNKYILCPKGFRLHSTLSSYRMIYHSCTVFMWPQHVEVP